MNHVKSQVNRWIERDKKSIIDLFSALVRCKTPSPPGDTREAMTLVKAFLSSKKLPFKEITTVETMPNLISTANMPAEGRHLMFSGHLDVLPAGNEPGWNDDPWSGKVSNGRVWGRGSSDMKAGVTAMLFAYMYLSRISTDLSGKLSIALASDEETGMGRGTGYMFEQIEREMVADCVLSAEPSGTDAIAFSSKGYLHFSVKVATRGAISGYPNASRSAIRIAMDIIRDLDVLEETTVNLPSSIADRLADPEYRRWLDNTYGEGTVDIIPVVSMNVGTIQGGCSAAVISPNCDFEVTVVMPVGLDPKSVFNKAKEIVDWYPEAQIHLEGADAADISDPEHEMTAILQQTVTGLGWPQPQMVPDIAISDLRYWRYRGIPGFWYGPNGENVSAANESVEIEELLHLVRTYVLASAEYLKKR
jgi:succinyl-diaminopimelate desuccinylase